MQAIKKIFHSVCMWKSNFLNRLLGSECLLVVNEHLRSISIQNKSRRFDPVGSSSVGQ